MIINKSNRAYNDKLLLLCFIYNSNKFIKEIDNEVVISYIKHDICSIEASYNSYSYFSAALFVVLEEMFNRGMLSYKELLKYACNDSFKTNIYDSSLYLKYILRIQYELSANINKTVHNNVSIVEINYDNSIEYLLDDIINKYGNISINYMDTGNIKDLIIKIKESYLQVRGKFSECLESYKFNDIACKEESNTNIILINMFKVEMYEMIEYFKMKDTNEEEKTDI